MTEGMAWVIDASVGIKLVLNEPDSLLAEKWVLYVRRHSQGALFVPDLFFAECANILWKHVCRYSLDPEEARKHLQQLRRLPVRRIPSETVAEDALELAIQHRISTYDAIYLALALRTKGSLLTADLRLVRQLDASSLPVCPMEFPAPKIP